MEIIEYQERYLEDVSDLLVELEEYIVLAIKRIGIKLEKTTGKNVDIVHRCRCNSLQTYSHTNEFYQLHEKQHL